MKTKNDALVTALFKPTAQGWVYRSPNPWIFGRATHYVVDDGQRAQIINALSPHHPLRTALWLSALLVLWTCLVASAMWALNSHFGRPTALELMGMIALIVAPCLIGLSVNAALKKKRIAPILDGAPTTHETITYREIRSMAIHARSRRSRRQVVGMALLWGLITAAQVMNLFIREARHPLFSDAMSWLMVVTLVLGVVNMVREVNQAVRSGRQARN